MAVPTMKTTQLQVLRKLKDDFPYYAKKNLKVLNKEGVLVSFVFNRAQRYIHAKLEEQKKKLGFIRAVIVKGRQQGASTYIEGREFHAVTLNSGTNVFILTHHADSTRHLFNMAKTFYENAPAPILPTIKTQNERRLEFENINSSYAVGTAGSANIGRSLTLQRFHGSEVAFWENTDAIMTGVIQAIPDSPGTEIIFESTANGVGGEFHATAMLGLDPGNESDFITIFTPWFWSDEYYREPPEDFVMDGEEEILANTYDLSAGQIYFRRRKIIDVFKGRKWQFRQEYPNTIQEAFVNSGSTLLSGEFVEEARKNRVQDPVAPLVIGVDPARSGDRTVIVIRRGREIMKHMVYEVMDEMTLAGILAGLIDQYPVIKCFIDVGNGYGTIDRLKELGYKKEAVPVNFGSNAMLPEIYVNKRAEMHDAFCQWFEEGGANIPDADDMHMDLMAIPPLEKMGSRGRLGLIPKKEIKKTYGKSPDIMDAACFLGNTLITTPRGRKRIQDLRVGDLVTTPFGARKILKTHTSLTNKLTTAVFSNGSELTGKPKHKVFSFIGGLIRLDMLSLVNAIETDNITRRFLWWLNRKLFTKGKRFGFKAQAGTINQAERTSRKGFCTVGSTVITMDQSQKGCTSTTKISTGQTMKLRIWKCVCRKSITGDTCLGGMQNQRTEKELKNISTTLDTKHQHGMDLKKAGNGMLSMGKRVGSVVNRRWLNVPCVVKNITLSIRRTVDSVLGRVANTSLIKDTRLQLESVWNVAKNLFLTSIGLKPVVPVDVRTFAVVEKCVYNITVEQEHVYYANGVLVENCLTFAFPVSPRAARPNITRVKIDRSRGSSPLRTVQDFNRNVNQNQRVHQAKLDLM